MRSVTAYATPGPKAPFQKTTIERRDLGPRDVLIKIAFAGICHSDIHTARAEWGKVIFPLVPGHEIAGIVEEVGAGVTRYAVGDRVGVGCMVDSCRECENCLAGEEQYCLNGPVLTYNDIGQGRPSHRRRLLDPHRRRPGLRARHPRRCRTRHRRAAALRRYHPVLASQALGGRRRTRGSRSSASVGSGHMGVKIAHALGAEVTVLSQSLSKQDDGRKLGADYYYATSDEATFKELKHSFDLIVSTVSATLPIDSYLSLLRLDGSLVNVGAPPAPMSVRAFSLMPNRRSLAGSSHRWHCVKPRRCWTSCAAHGLGAEIEVIGGEQIDHAYDRVVDSDVRYRFVIDTASF